MNSRDSHMMINRIGLLVAAALCLAGPLSGEVFADVVYQQTSNFPGTTNFYAFTSSYDSGGSGTFYQSYDNFSLANAATISSLTWQGFSFDADTLGGTSVPVTSFYVDFYSNSGGIPGSLVYTEDVGFVQSAAGSTDFFGNGNQETIYNYTASLTTSFMAAAGTTYWLSVEGVTNYTNNSALWAWTSGEGGDGESYQTSPPAYGNSSSTKATDLAFSLLSPSVVPEPSSLVLCGIAILSGLGLAKLSLKRAD